MSRPNLTVITKALASKILVEGQRATGVAYTKNGQAHTATARTEVLLCGGAINSPQLLQLSGIGPGDLLQKHGIEVVADLKGVGDNLQDHYVIPQVLRLKSGVVSVNEMSKGSRLLGEAVKYLFQRKGLLSLSAAHIAIFCKSRPDLAGPDIQFHALPASVDSDKLASEGKFELENHPGLTIAPCQLRPESRGTVRIRSTDPTVHPAIDPNYLSDSLDQEIAVAGLRWGRKIAEQAALAAYVDGETSPGPHAINDADLLAHARTTGTTIYHPVGTCAMGTDPRAVVDPQLRVRGIDSLRVVDASIMPRLVSGNTNAPTIMIAEKAADLILRRTGSAH